MCGIAGILNFDAQARVNPELLRRMTDLILHRGPDDGGLHVDGAVGLGNRRLSIIDLSAAGHQPMSNADGSVWITYNGECYNHEDFIAELEARGYRFRSTSDTETLLHLYEAHGPAFLDRIEGMYALAIWDARRHTLLLARDRLGIKPLYYYQDKDHIVFASELKALLADASLPTDVSDIALGDFLHLMSIPDPESILRGVRKLLPGHYLIAEGGRCTERAYWTLAADRPPRAMDLPTACDEFEVVFRGAVRSHLLADVPVGAFLSGGVDSSGVVAMASREARKPMATFVSSFRGLTEFDESGFAREVADLYRTDHHEFDLTPELVDALPRIAWHADEPFAISSALPLYFLSQLARRHVKVVLTGDGGDELFAGYTWRHVAFAEQRESVRRRVLTVLRTLASTARGGAAPRDDRYVRSFSCYQDEDLEALLVPQVAERLRRVWADNVTQRYYDELPHADELQRKLYTDVRSTLVSEMLTKVDRMTMAFGLEARVPFLDHRLVEWAFQVPAPLKMRGRDGKWLVKKTLERYLPAPLIHRPKHGFNVPMRTWMRHELREFVEDSLSASVLKRRGLFRPDVAGDLVRDHLDGTLDASNKIFVLLMLELWFQRFVDGRADVKPLPAQL